MFIVCIIIASYFSPKHLAIFTASSILTYLLFKGLQGQILFAKSDNDKDDGPDLLAGQDDEISGGDLHIYEQSNVDDQPSDELYEEDELAEGEEYMYDEEDYITFVRRNGKLDEDAPVIGCNYQIDAEEFMMDAGEFKLDKSAERGAEQLARSKMNERAIKGQMAQRRSLRTEKIFGSAMAANEKKEWWNADD